MEGVSISLHRKTLVVQTSRWRTFAESTSKLPHFGILRMNLRVQSLYPVCRHPAMAPHGVLGQTFDCDGLAVDGNLDQYDKLPDIRATSSARKLVMTQAQAEGAIEGNVDNYEVRWPFDWSFAFSRFATATAAGPRNVSLLGRVLREPKRPIARHLSSCECANDGQ